jgi:hypothetical protein
MLLLFAACLALTLFSATAAAQKAKTAGKDDEPCFSEYKGIKIGMTVDESRQKLGAPKDQADEVDIYNFSDKESAQVYYDKSTQKITAISVDYVGAANAPECKKITGTEADARADGSRYKMVRYPKAGYWVSYSRTAGTSPIVTVTMQKMH